MKQLVPAVFYFLFSFFNAAAQNIDSTIEKYANDYSQERTYLHFDKIAYAAGETIWFKAYIMDGILPSVESKTFYVDWTDEKGKLLSHALVPAVYSTAWGQFDIPADYAGKLIHVKAYTKWMLNFDSSFLYNKDIRILSNNSNVPSPKIPEISSLQFFPEGGDAVSGVENKIAFKANDQYGKPVNIKGFIFNDKGVKIDSLHAIHDGMGYFFLIPKPGESYTAKWSVRTLLEKEEKSIEHITALPPVKQKGISLRITLNGASRNFIVSASPGSAASFGTLHLLGTMNQHEVFKFSKDISNGTIEGIIPTGELPSGILTVTVFDEHWKPLAERITYINNQDYIFNAEMNVEHWGLNNRARNEIQITVPDSLPASFSVAVTDVDIETDSSDNIISHLMLTGDLKGKVYTPSWYFSNNSDSLAQQLDLVMLTHGWRRFKWDDVVTGRFPKINYPRDSAYLTLSGIIYGALPSQLKGAGNIILMMNPTKQRNRVVEVPVNPNGTFSDPSIIIFDTTKIYYQFPKSSGLSDVSVKFMEGRLPPFSYNIPASGNFYNHAEDTSGNFRHFQMADSAQQILNLFKGKVLETVTIKARTKSELEQLDEKYTSGMFAGGDSYQFDLLHDPSAFAFSNIFIYLQGKVPGLTVNASSDPPTLTWRGGTPLIFLDESPTDPSLLTSISLSSIAYVKVLHPPFMGSSNGGSGAIAIYTRRGGDVKDDSKQGLSNNTVSGYTSMREFYSPNYDTFSADNDKRDVRTTLYWNPQINTTRTNNKATFTFYNNDISGAFRVILEGMSSDGRLVHLENIME